MTTLAELLDPMTVEGVHYERLKGGAVRCYTCGHRCLIRPARRGFCKVRFNREGVLPAPWGYVILSYRITSEGTCSMCGNVIAGVWPRSASQVHLGSVDDIFYRRPRLVRL